MDVGDSQSFCKTGWPLKKINNADRKIFYLLDYFFLFARGSRFSHGATKIDFFQFSTALCNKSLKTDN